MAWRTGPETFLRIPSTLTRMFLLLRFPKEAEAL